MGASAGKFYHAQPLSVNYFMTSGPEMQCTLVLGETKDYYCVASYRTIEYSGML
jgi:hypothetical protein